MVKKINMSKNFESRPYTEAEENAMYGSKTKPVGQAYKKYDGYYNHFYLQRESDVLHVNVKGQLLNVLNVGFLNDRELEGFVEITIKEFTEAVKEFIYSAEVDKYWN